MRLWAKRIEWRNAPTMIVFLDSNIVIYYIEHDPFWGPKVSERFKKIMAAEDSLATSDAVRLETLVGPFQSGDAQRVTEYQKFFDSTRVQMLPVTPAVWERAARIRATNKFQTLDSIHLATAMEHHCGIFLTNDALLATFNGIKVELQT